MIKKITIGVLLTILVLAFSPKIPGLSQIPQLIFKICKGLIFITIIFVLMKHYGLLTKSYVLKKISGNTFIKLIPVIIILTVYLILSVINTTVDINVSVTILALNIFGCFIAASGEEVIFRGYIFNVANKEGYSSFKSLIISSVIFSSVHILNILQHGNFWSILNQLIFAFALGMLLGSIFALTKNLLVVCLLHFAINIPAVLSSLSTSNEIENALNISTLTDHLLSTLIFVILMTPVMMLSFYYIKLAKGSDKEVDDLPGFSAS